MRNGVAKILAYTYNLDGSVATLTYPSGRTINYNYNAAARPTLAVDTANLINYGTDVISGQPNVISCYFADHLGTARVVTDASGTVLDDSDFYPFGGGLDMNWRRHFAIRVFQADYIPTRLSGTWEKHYSVSTGIVFRFALQ